MFGRDGTINELERRLEKKSILFVAERRVGKTTVLKALEKQLKENEPQDIVIFSDLEGITSPNEFVDKIEQILKPYLSRTSKVRILGRQGVKEARNFVKSIAGVEIHRDEPSNWKPKLEKMIKEVCEASKYKVIFLWDEIPYMLHHIQQKESKNLSTDNAGLIILDTLRALRQTHENLRMVYTGSIGIHHVLQVLKQQTSSEPINDLLTIELVPIAELDAIDMAKSLFATEGLQSEELDRVVKSLIQQCDYIPFYIEKVIFKIACEMIAVTIELIDRVIEETIVSADDTLQMEHFKSRLNDYYRGVVIADELTKIAHADIAKELLNSLAIASAPLSIDDCFQHIKSFYPLEDRTTIVELLNSLAKDFYIFRDTKGGYVFKYTLIQRWWLMSEGLTRTGEEE